MSLPEDWKKIQVPLGLTAVIVASLLGVWAWMHSEFVQAGDFKEAIQSIEVRGMDRDIRGLERDKRSVENETFKLEVKKEAMPRKFDAMDKALLNKYRKDIQKVDEEIKEMLNKKRTLELQKK